MLCAALVVTLTPKIMLESHSAHTDTSRLNADIAERLRAAGFSVRIAPLSPDTVVVATRGRCEAMIRDGDRARELRKLFQLQATGWGPVAIGYRDRWTAHPAGTRSVIERTVQNVLQRLGWTRSRPAVLALARRGICPNFRHLFTGLQIYAMSKSAGIYKDQH